jgi:TolB protein
MNADGSNQFQVSADDDPWFHAPPRVALSPDGLVIAFSCQPTAHVNDICIINANGSGRTQLTGDLGNNYDPRWTRDGRIVFTHRGDDNNEEIYIMNTDGSGMTNLTNSPANESTTVPRPSIP